MPTCSGTVRRPGWTSPGEQAGHYPSAPPNNGGVGMLTSFGEEIQQTRCNWPR